MNNVSNGSHLRRDLKNILTERHRFSSEETLFCTENNLEQSLRILFEEFESFGISPVTVHNDPQTLEPLRKLSVKVINATWNLIHKYRSLMQQHDQLIETNHKTISDNINLKVSFCFGQWIYNNMCCILRCTEEYDCESKYVEIAIK